MCSTVEFISDPTLAEAMAARKGVEFAKMLGLRSFLMEGDSLEIVEAIRNGEDSSKRYRGVVHDILVKLSDFHMWGISFVCRGGNRVAHEIAKIDVSLSLHQVWIDTFPSSLSNCIQKDYCNLAT
jgi:uncharacterized protein YwbE